MSHIITQGSMDELPELMLRIQDAALEGGCEVTIKQLDEATAKQFRHLWATLRDISRQVDWHGQKLDEYDWKLMMTATLEKLRVVPAIDGQGFVVLGQSLKRMNKSKMSDLIAVAIAFGQERGVQWKDPNWVSMMAEYSK